MNQYRISFYYHNAIDPRDRDQIQRGVVNAESEEIAREIFSFTNCEVISVELIETAHVFSYAEMKAGYLDDYGADYQERKDLYTTGNGG